MSILPGIYASQITGHLSTNSYESIATYTASGGETSFTFSSIPSTYKHLQIRYLARATDTAVDTYFGQLALNGDTGSNYANHQLTGNGAAAYGDFAGGTSTSATKAIIGFTMPTAGDGGTYGAGIVDILDYQNTNKYKTIRALSGYDTNNVQNGTYVKGGIIQLSSSLWMNTAAVTSVTVKGVNGFSVNSSIALYGVKG